MHARMQVASAQLISTASQSERPVALCRAAARALETVQPNALYQDPLAETLAGEDAMVYVRNTSMGVNPKVWRSKRIQMNPGTKLSDLGALRSAKAHPTSQHPTNVLL